ncbi:S1-like domain-containing RNA-binding protein [Acholeplasma hippikon]|uniref:Conserved virulence factor B n=1 Tax=Acholeplasma hippikon TaxID=264636 RepID=A0A449BJZ7_9MOLU|nr:S1-like domain-containing RNA-binding protein [Acholeplasma hippikon]VEU82740.1 Conserved virulence factor B [Acholeplasma hippikon]
MALEVGKINLLQVVRKTDIAYLLKNKENEEVFLHINESDHQKLVPNQIVEAFLYYDAKGRLAATLHEPKITLGNPGLLEVVSVKPGLGVFLDLGISKDVLLSKDDLGDDESLWPQVGEKLYVDLKVKTKMTARLIPYNEIRVITGNLEIGKEYDGFVQVIGKIGYFIYTEEGNLVLVKKSNTRQTFRLGEAVKVKVTFETKSGYEGTLGQFKEVVRVDDSKMIMDFLEKTGEMPYTADTDSETITQVFGLSRKAFKRALGLLYKQRKVEFRDGKTYLVK